MTDPNSCPLCAEQYDDRNGLRVHLEVEHRKSEIVTTLIDLNAAGSERAADGDRTAVGDEPPAPPV